LAVKRRLVLSTVALLLAGLALAVYRISTVRRTASVRRAFEAARRRFDFPTAHDRLLACLKLHPDDAESHLLAAQCSRRAEFVESFRGPGGPSCAEASGHLDAAERLGASQAAVELERTLACVQNGQFAGREGPLIDRVKRGEPDAPLILEALVHGYLRNLRCEKALACAEALLKLEPDNVLALLWRGRIREQTRQLRGSREDYLWVVQLVPEFDAARYYLAESLLRANRLGDAGPHLEVLNARAPGNLLVRLAWAKYRIAVGDEAAAGPLLESWLADAPGDHPRLLEALTACAGVALARGRPALAEDFARRALHESPLDQHALYHLAQSLNAQGRRTEAQPLEEQLDKIKQDLQTVARCRERLARAPDDLPLRHEIGAAYLRVGRTGEALVWLNSVLDRDPNYLPTLRTLAELHAQAGNRAGGER
jgi:predicted Zn-dependent protease